MNESPILKSNVVYEYCSATAFKLSLLKTTPLGTPVVPLVYTITAGVFLMYGASFASTFSPKDKKSLKLYAFSKISFLFFNLYRYFKYQGILSDTSNKIFFTFGSSFPTASPFSWTIAR